MDQAAARAEDPTATPSVSPSSSPGPEVPRMIVCHDPATGELLGQVPVMGPDEVRRRIAAARRAQVEWGQTSFAERRRVLGVLLEEILDHADELCEVICRDAGKTRENAMIGEIWPICEKIRWTIRNGEKHLSPERVSAGILPHKVATIEFEPLGVVANICPWNFPLQNILGPVIPALMSGNASVVKVSEWTSWSVGPFGELLDRVFDATGHSRDLVQLVTGYAETGAAVVSGGVDKVFFTGSLPNGKKVIAESAKTCTPVVLELGGKDPMIVCDDAELEQAVHTAVSGTFIASGQMCLAAERIYVFDAVYDEFVGRVVELASKLRQGAPLMGQVVDVGAMTMPGQVDIVQRLVDDAVSKGAKVLVGGKKRASGSFFEPTVLADVDHSMEISRHETFGPVLCIYRVRGEEQAIALANDTEYGLSSSVFTRDTKRAARIGRAIRAGSTVVNDFALNYMAQDLPFGGVGGSGFGRLNGRDGLRGCCNIKSVISDRFPIHRPVKLFPVKAGDYEVTRGTIGLVYRKGLVPRAKAALDLARGVLARVRGRR